MSEEEDFDQFFGEEEAELESRELEGVEDFSNEEEEELNGEEDSNEVEEINDSPTSASITLKSIKTPTDRGFIVSFCASIKDERLSNFLLALFN